MSNLPRKVLFIAPHADDIEVLCSSICQAAVNGNYEVHECLACADEYGTKRVDFRGRKLARIRKKEMWYAAQMYGTKSDLSPKIQLHWMPQIDGYVPFSAESVNRYKILIEKIHPYFIFGPDPFFGFGLHNDHINTGKNYYFALKFISPEKRPKGMYFFQTFNPDKALPIISRAVEYCARIQHRSQWPAIAMKLLALGDHFLKRTKVTAWRLAEPIRSVQFNSRSNMISESDRNILLRIKRAWWMYTLKFGYTPQKYFSKPPVQTILDDYNANGWV
jgi:LmbE family N-acetylglucosaminyl deacetylase